MLAIVTLNVIYRTEQNPLQSTILHFPISLFHHSFELFLERPDTLLLIDMAISLLLLAILE
jgi:hypothetical protein